MKTPNRISLISIRFFLSIIILLQLAIIDLIGFTLELENSKSCIQNDTLDLLPDWNYCEIASELKKNLPFYVPNDGYERIIIDGEVRIPDLLTLDSLRTLAWCVRKTTVDLRKHNPHVGVTERYTDFALLLVWFRYRASEAPQAAMIVMVRDTGAAFMNNSWRIHSTITNKGHKRGDSASASDYIPHTSIHLFKLPLNDAKLADNVGKDFLQILFEGNSKRWNGDIREEFFRGAIRRETWNQYLGTIPLENLRVD
jgi:hypothetical protein